MDYLLGVVVVISWSNFQFWLNLLEASSFYFCGFEFIASGANLVEPIRTADGPEEFDLADDSQDNCCCK